MSGLKKCGAEHLQPAPSIPPRPARERRADPQRLQQLVFRDRPGLRGPARRADRADEELEGGPGQEEGRDSTHLSIFSPACTVGAMFSRALLGAEEASRC